MTDYPHVQAAHINAIAEEGTKADAIEYLQKCWNEKCYLKAENERLREALEKLEELAAPRCYWFAVEVFTICTEALRGKDG